MVVLGTFFLWSNISVYVLSYFYEFNPNINVSFIFIVDSALILANWIGYNIGTYLLQNRRWHPRVIVGLGGTISLSGIYLSSYTKSLGPYLALYTGANGIGCGMSYLVPMVVGWEYFPNRKGLITGITISSYGFSSFAFSLISTAIVNPTHAQATIVYDNINLFDASVADRVPLMIRTLDYIWMGFVVVADALLTRKSKENFE